METLLATWNKIVWFGDFVQTYPTPFALAAALAAVYVLQQSNCGGKNRQK